MRRLYSKVMSALTVVALSAACTDLTADQRERSDDLQATAFGAPVAIDSNAGAIAQLEIAVEPDGDSAMAVWVALDQTYIDPGSGYAFPIYRLYARRFAGGQWLATDAGCPVADGSSDGVCVLSLNNGLGAWAPRVALNALGEAVVVWQQSDGGRWRIHARRFTGGAWSGVETLDDDSGPAGDAGAPDIALARAGAGLGRAAVVWEQRRPTEPWRLAYDGSTFNDGVIRNYAANSVRAFAVFLGVLYAAEGDDAGHNRVFRVLDGVTSFPASGDNAGANFSALLPHGRYLFAAQAQFNEIAIFNCIPTQSQRADRCEPGDWNRSISLGGQYDSVALAVLGNSLYAAGSLSGTDGRGDIRVCDPLLVDNELPPVAGFADEVNCRPVDWNPIPIFDGGAPGRFYQTTPALAVFNGRLYAGFGGAGGGSGRGGDIYGCDPARSADLHFDGRPNTTSCTVNDWALAFDGSVAANNALGKTYTEVDALGVFDGKLYAGLSAGGGPPDLVVCDPAGAGPDPTACDAASEWRLAAAFTAPAGYTEVRTLFAFGGRLFAGLGSAADRGDVWHCDDPDLDGVCEPSEWIAADPQPDASGRYEQVNVMASYFGKLYIGMGNGLDDDDIYVLESVGWRVFGRVLAGGIGAGSWGPLATLDADQGEATQPRVGMDGSGRAMATWYQFISGNCFDLATISEGGTDRFTSLNRDGKAVIIPNIRCADDRLYARHFDGVSWNAAATDITPGWSMLVPCWELDMYDTENRPLFNDENGLLDPDYGEPSSACVDVGPYDMKMDDAGNTTVVMKTFEWMLPEEGYATVGNRPNYTNYVNTFTQQEVRLYARRAAGATWAPLEPKLGEGTNWPATVLARWFFRVVGAQIPGGVVLSSSNCGGLNNFLNSQDATDTRGGALGGARILNCDFDAPRLGAPNAAAGAVGTRALVVAEQYSSAGATAATAVRDLVLFRLQENPAGTFAWQRFAGGGSWVTVKAGCAGNSAAIDPPANTCTAPGIGDDPDTAFVAVDAGAQDARAPRVAMDDAGNGVLVWSQFDGAGWRVYARNYNGASGTFSAPTPVDQNVVAGASFFSPAVDAAGNGVAHGLFLSLKDGVIRLFGMRDP